MVSAQNDDPRVDFVWTKRWLFACIDPAWAVLASAQDGHG